MNLILNIDTAIDKALVSIAGDGVVLEELVHDNQKDHAAFLQPAIQLLIKKTGITLNELSAVAVADGPGSYTGLRVGMASAKGLCYALDKPLIIVGSLHILARQAIEQLGNIPAVATYLFHPMIDARRMEVFAAMFSAEEKLIEEPHAMILNHDSLVKQLLTNKIVFCGNGADKWSQLCNHPNAIFIKIESNTLAMSKLSYEKFANNQFADTIYAEPSYLKEFFSTASL